MLAIVTNQQFCTRNFILKYMSGNLAYADFRLTITLAHNIIVYCSSDSLLLMLRNELEKQGRCIGVVSVDHW